MFRLALLNAAVHNTLTIKRSINTIISGGSTNILSYKIIGEDTAKAADNPKPPILIFHGLMSNKKHWEGIGKTISNITKRIIVVVDLRNHGDSPHINSHKYEDLAADIVHLIDKLGIKQASLMGYSMGGKAAMCVALTTPMKVAGLLVIDTSPISTPPQYINDFPKLLTTMNTIKLSPKNLAVARKEAKKELKKHIKVSDFVMKSVLSNIVIKSDNKIGWACNLDVLIKHFNYIASFPTWKKAKTYYGPTAFIGGQLSDFIPPDDLPKIRSLFPNAVINYLHGCGHNLHEDDPRSFIELAIYFIRQHHYRNVEPPAASFTPTK